MIKQGLNVCIVPDMDRDGSYSVSIYSVGYEKGFEKVTRHVLIAPVRNPPGTNPQADFSLWIEDMVLAVGETLGRSLLVADVSTLSAAYAHAEDTEDKAMHRQ